MASRKRAEHCACQSCPNAFSPPAAVALGSPYLKGLRFRVLGFRVQGKGLERIVAAFGGTSLM